MAEASAQRAGWAWMALAGALVLGALLAAPVDRETLDWQPALALAQPWRAWSAVFVHYSTLHLIANLAGAALVGAVGQAAPLPARSALAWFVAWPLTQLGLLLQPGLLHYGGLSGVLHAGVAVAGVHLAWAGRSRQRTIGLAMLAVLALKVLGEAPWGAALRHPSGWDIAVAPLAHATGALSGVICAVLAEAWQRRQ